MRLRWTRSTHYCCCIIVPTHVLLSVLRVWWCGRTHPPAGKASKPITRPPAPRALLAILLSKHLACRHRPGEWFWSRRVAAGCSFTLLGGESPREHVCRVCWKSSPFCEDDLLPKRKEVAGPASLSFPVGSISSTPRGSPLFTPPPAPPSSSSCYRRQGSQRKRHVRCGHCLF